MLKNRGQELVEFALVVPLLLIVAFGVLDLGRAFHAAITIENAARVGARYGSMHPGDDADIITAACNEAQQSGLTINCGSITVSYSGGSISGQPVRVTVSYNFEIILGVVFPDSNITMTRSAEMLIP